MLEIKKKKNSENYYKHYFLEKKKNFTVGVNWDAKLQKSENSCFSFFVFDKA